MSSSLHCIMVVPCRSTVDMHGDSGATPSFARPAHVERPHVDGSVPSPGGVS